MKKYIAVDSGKFATKVSVANEKLDGSSEYKFRTRMGAGSFDDDAVEAGTYVASIDGNVLKIGNGAPKDADLETSKKTEIHRMSALLALALAASPDGKDEFYAAAGMPVGPYRNVEERKEYKEYILPAGKHKVEYMGQDGKVNKKEFIVAKQFVYPESAGGLYLDMQANKDAAAVIDIGNVNVNATYFQNFEPDYECSGTSELGGQILISGVAAGLSSRFSSRVDERLASRTLKLPKDQRYLHPVRTGTGIEEASAAYISEYLVTHVKEIKRMCDSLRWPLDYLNLTFIGGTSELLKEELRQVFGDTITIPDKPEYVNARGFLRRLVAWEEKTLIPMQ